jgi:crossover junction endodeoxyribonuclease RuvC
MPTLPDGKGKNLVSPVGVFEIVEAFAPDVAWVERVSAMPKQGVASSFNFGSSYGIVLGVLGAVKVPYHLVPASTWKKHFSLGADKRAARTAATRLFPRQSALFVRAKDDGRAEAALIARFGQECCCALHLT